MINYKCINGGDCKPVLRPPYRCPVSGFIMLTTRRCEKCERAYAVTEEDKLKYN